MKNISFKYRIFLGISFVVILYALFTIGFIKLYMTKVLHEEAVSDGLAFTKVVAENMRSLPVSTDVSSLNAYLRHTMETNPEISYIFLQNDSKVLAHTFNGTFPYRLLEEGRGQTGAGYRIFTLGNDTYYDFSAPIGPSSGTLRIGISERLGTDTTGHVIFVLAGITLIILAAALAISALVARRLTRRLTKLSSQAAEMANRNIARPVEMSAKDEIDRLKIAFETMLQTVREREDDLTEINNELETVNLTLHEYIEKLRLTRDELIKTKQDTAVVDTARSFLHHVRQPLTYLIMAIEMLSNDIRNSGEVNITSLQKVLNTIEEASEKLSELLRKFDNLKEYKVIRFDEITKITDIG